jgi:hypothetical protein
MGLMEGYLPISIMASALLLLLMEAQVLGLRYPLRITSWKHPSLAKEAHKWF